MRHLLQNTLGIVRNLFVLIFTVLRWLMDVDLNKYFFKIVLLYYTLLQNENVGTLAFRYNIP
jgi:hypothetical protein